LIRIAWGKIPHHQGEIPPVKSYPGRYIEPGILIEA